MFSNILLGLQYIYVFLRIALSVITKKKIEILGGGRKFSFGKGIIASLIPGVGLNYKSLPVVQKVYGESL
jgi:hypothetical protein